jgi:DoxX-like family
MHTAYLIVTLVAAAFVGLSAWALFAHAAFIMEPLDRLKIPHSWWPWLATAKALGAIGLVAGLFVPAIGVLAAICLVLYFAGAVVTTLRVRWFRHIPVPLVYVVPVVACLVFGFAAGWPHWNLGAYRQRCDVGAGRGRHRRLGRHRPRLLGASGLRRLRCDRAFRLQQRCSGQCRRRYPAQGWRCVGCTG